MRFTLPELHEIEHHHFRRYESVGGLTYLADIPLDPEDELLPQGGMTVAEVVDPDGHVVAIGTSSCSKMDNFNKKLGRNIATGRALKNVALQSS